MKIINQSSIFEAYCTTHASILTVGKILRRYNILIGIVREHSVSSLVIVRFDGTLRRIVSSKRPIDRLGIPTSAQSAGSPAVHRDQSYQAYSEQTRWYKPKYCITTRREPAQFTYVFHPFLCLIRGL